MEPTREIYWNVGHGVTWRMYLFSLVAITVLLWGFSRRIPVYRLGKPLNRLDQLPRRIWLMLRSLLVQSRVLRVAGPGALHAVFFWGFFLLFIGTLLVMAQADFSQPLLGIVFLKGTFYEIFSLVLDIAGLAALLMLGGFLVRRFFVKPKGLETIGDDYLILALLFVILLTGFVVEGARMAVTELQLNPALARFSPVGLLVGELLSSLTRPQLLLTHKVLWWFHFFLAMGFIAAIPFTKLRHIFTTSANYLFSDLRPKGMISTINLEEEGVEQFGAAKITDLTWKDVFDADACTSCKRCQDRCPAWNTDKPLSPMKVVKQIGELAFQNHDASLVAAITEDVLWACTTCYACQEVCPANIEHVVKIVEMRRHLALMEGSFPGDEVKNAVNNIEVNGNPFGIAFAERGDWAKDLAVNLPPGAGHVDILYFVGCYASFDKRSQEVARGFMQICAAAGIKVGILGKHEKCCGDPVRKLGNEYLYQTLARENIDLFTSNGVQKIVTTCPHCFNTLSKDYRDLGLRLPVEHYTTFLHRLVGSGSLKITTKEFDCTFHDSCYMARYNDVADEPRELLRTAGARITEMAKCKNETFCCGAGGGRILAEERIGRRINSERISMAAGTGAPMVVSNCPFCLTMFEDGIKTADLEGKLRARDLAELIAERVNRNTEAGQQLAEVTMRRDA
jgi:Fe-S oxidoreductase/nitrate reductase gamma subunit